MLQAWKTLAAIVDGQEVSNEQLTALLERPTTLKSAINAAFYKSVGFGIDRYL